MAGGRDADLALGLRVAGGGTALAVTACADSDIGTDSEAAHYYADLPEEAIRNHELLREVMENHGFTALEPEWLHYDCQDWERSEVMNLPLESVS